MPKALIRIDFDGHRLGPGKVELMEHIAETGSILQAAKKMDMSYRRAWLLIDELNKMFTEHCVSTAAGGAGGGGAKVTDFGKKVIAAYHGVENKIASDVDESFKSLR